MIYKTMNDLSPEVSTKSFLSVSLCLQLKKLRGKTDPVQTKHQLFETKLLLHRGHVME